MKNFSKSDSNPRIYIAP